MTNDKDLAPSSVRARGIGREEGIMRRAAWVVVSILISLVLFPWPAGACTAFRLTASDGTVLSVRSMEFAVDLKYDVLLVPRNRAYTSPAPGGKKGLSWKTRYGFAGIAQFGMEHGVSDGINEAGLAMGMLWFESDMKWQDVAPGEEDRALAQLLVGDWLLGNFSTVEEVKREVPKVKVFGYTDPGTSLSPTVHFVVYDAAGGCAVIEYEDGQCRIYDNPLGIMTNAPSFPWQLANLRQYIGMRSELPPPCSASGVTFTATGHGAGMIGLPGDLTPPSRFVRLATLTRFAEVQPDAARTLNLARHIINTFDIPFGLVTDTMPDKTVRKESTQWVTYRDSTNRVLYFTTYDNCTFRRLDLKKLDFSKPALKRVPMTGSAELFLDVGPSGD
jgi:choloylglycine hydrolase